MHRIRVRMMVLVLTALLTAGTLGLSARAVEVYEGPVQVREESAERAERTVLSILGLAFLCAGGMVALIMAKDRT